MKKYSKAIAAILAALICLSMCAFNAFAVEGEEQSQQSEYSEGGDSQVDDGQSGGESSEDPYAGPVDDGGASSSDIPYIPESSDYESDESSNYSPEYYESSDSYDDDEGGYVYYDGDGNSYSNQDDVYVGGGQSYQPPVSTAPSAALYDSDSKIDVNELSKNDWGDIAKLLKNTGSSDSDGDDFAFIQKNTSKSDNGHWIIICGAACILLSITGFIYLIASKISRKRKIKAGNITKTSNPQRNNSQHRANNEYGDGYKTVPANKSNQSSKNAGHYTYTANGKNNKSGKGGKRYR